MQEPPASKSVMSDAMETDAVAAEREFVMSPVGTPTSHTSAEPDGGALPGQIAALLGSGTSSVSQYAERARYIPMRLNLEERRLFNLLEAALSVSDYTDKVDIWTWNKTNRIVAQVKDICSILSGLKVAQVRAAVMHICMSVACFAMGDHFCCIPTMH
jgi:hypothetical protein